MKLVESGILDQFEPKKFDLQHQNDCFHYIAEKGQTQIPYFLPIRTLNIFRLYLDGRGIPWVFHRGIIQTLTFFSLTFIK